MSWYLQIFVGEFVRWGYGPGTFDSGMHTERARVGVEDFIFEFELPEHNPKSSLRPPQEYGRKRCVGWRFNNGRGHDNGWHLCGSVDDAKIEALAWAQKEYDRDPFKRTGFLDGVRDVRVEIEESK